MVLTLVQVAGIAYFSCWIPNKFYSLIPLGFVIAIVVRLDLMVSL